MKVLYIGYYKEDSEWGRQATNIILALDAAGIDVVCRNLDLGQTKKGCPAELMHLENKSVEGADYCIQHVFPDHMVGSKGVFKKNVALLNRHFVDIDHTSWTEKLSMMDEVWLWAPPIPFSSDQTARVFALDLDVYKTPYRNLNIPQIGDDFVFYTIQRSLDITGLSWVMAAFHAEFYPSENVSLVLHVESDPQNSQKCLETIENLSASIKTNLRVHGSLDMYKKDVIISSPGVTQSNRFELHSMGDCYVSSSPSVAIQFNEIDAIAFGNSVLLPSNSLLDIGVGDVAKVNSIYQCMQSPKGMWQDVNNGKDYSILLCERDLRRHMRRVFDKASSLPTPKIKVKSHVLRSYEDYSLEKAGKLMEKLLNV
jgi:hypothetical protein